MPGFFFRQVDVFTARAGHSVTVIAGTLPL